MLSDVRSAARGLLRTPTVAISGVLCLALGIGATAAISSAISRAIFQSLPFRDAGSLVAVHRTTPQSGPLGTWPLSPPNYVDLAQRTRTVDGLAALTFGTALVALPSEAIQASQMYVTGNFFQTLGARAEIGRLVTPGDDHAGEAPVAVLSDEFWRSRLGADSSIVGKTLSIDGEPTTIVGVTPPDFHVPHGYNVLRADIWMPIRFTAQQLTNRRSNSLLLLGRLAPGATETTAQTELRTVFAGIVAENPQLRGEDVRVAALQAENVGAVRTPLLLLLAAVGMVLLIAATNVAALLLARGVQRRREIAVRTALGAGRWATMRTAFIESLLITLAGVVLGLVIAMGGVRTIGALASARLPQLAGLSVDGRVIVFALVLSIVVGVACGLVPAWRSAAVDPQDALRGGRGGGSGREQHRALRSLVVLEIALSLVLLIGAGLVLKGFAGLLGNDPGFETAHVLTLRVTTAPTRYADPNQPAAKVFLEPALAAIRALPGIESAGSINSVPYVNWGNNSNVRYEGQPKVDPTRQPIVEYRAVSPEFFAVTHQRLLAGRLLQPSDDNSPSSPPVVVVNQALVDRDLKGMDPIGKRFHLTDTSFATIVGVVSNIRNFGPIAPSAPEMYWTYLQSGQGASFPIMVRVKSGDPANVAPSVRAAIRSVDPTAAIADMMPMPDVIATSLGQPRFYLSLLGAFAVVALVLAVAGLYGVLSYAVAQRTRELGIRAALGSSSAALMRLMALEGMRLVGIGMVLGSLGGVAVTRFITFALYGVSPLDGLTWVLSLLLMVLAGLAATLVPARRATRVNPLIAIQAD